MKLVIILGVVNHQKSIRKMLMNMGLAIFSEIDVKGFKSTVLAKLEDNWFGHGENEVNSTVNFSFVSDSETDRIVQAVKDFNGNNNTSTPIKYFELNVGRYV
ncbi:hypothetical protein [Aureibacter tunicatorum]|uniref:Uncharacterized protein n=1 Tax=Aureibacter tunicatorum TaxID=866807 RepID=A0AAE3XR00_9BACT|nr:hypothetical protein [Aureibacter tunicatorum]MDR6240997.1 hypothetical protein [Aureibacter tunicatorum]BDD03776.1 hypothetical protein AUTU_12590 [Aureibacter tunicatorum]